MGRGHAGKYSVQQSWLAAWKTQAERQKGGHLRFITGYLAINHNPLKGVRSIQRREEEGNNFPKDPAWKRDTGRKGTIYKLYGPLAILHAKHGFLFILIEMLHQQTNQGQFPCGNKHALGLHWPYQTYTYDLLCLCVCKTRVTIRWNLLERPQAKHKTLLMLMTPFFQRRCYFTLSGCFCSFLQWAWIWLLGCPCWAVSVPARGHRSYEVTTLHLCLLHCQGQGT